VLETALVLPIMLALVAGYVAILIQVDAQVRMQSAVSLATSAALTVPPGDQAAGCRAVTGTFYGTVYGTAALPPSSDCSSVPPPPPGAFLEVTSFSCPEMAYLRATAPDRLAKVRCEAKGMIDYSKTPVGFAVLWKPTFTMTATVRPSRNRQCGIAVCPDAAPGP